VSEQGRELLFWWKAEHRRIGALPSGRPDPNPYCTNCGETWPCSTFRLIAALEEALVIPFDLTYDERQDRVLSKLVPE